MALKWDVISIREPSGFFMSKDTNFSNLLLF
jgi:hypothetical protein